MKTIFLFLVSMLALAGCSRSETESQPDATKPSAGYQSNSATMNTMANHPDSAIINKMDTNIPATTNPPPM